LSSTCAEWYESGVPCSAAQGPLRGVGICSAGASEPLVPPALLRGPAFFGAPIVNQRRRSGSRADLVAPLVHLQPDARRGGPWVHGEVDSRLWRSEPICPDFLSFWMGFRRCSLVDARHLRSARLRGWWGMACPAPCGIPNRDTIGAPSGGLGSLRAGWRMWEGQRVDGIVLRMNWRGFCPAACRTWALDGIRAVSRPVFRKIRRAYWWSVQEASGNPGRLGR
jgi:hypothetical protein